MAIVFPLPPEVFWRNLKIAQLDFSLGEAVSLAETGGGEILSARRGARLWSCVVRVTSAKANNQDQIVAFVDVIRQSGASVMVYDPKRAFPQADPGGVLQVGQSCFVLSIAANRRDVTLAGLPAGYTLTTGDLMSITYGADPDRHYLGRILVGGNFVAGDPNLLTVELVPPLPPGVSSNDSVQLVRPACKAVYVPGSYQGPTRVPGFDTGFSFNLRQTLR